MKRKRFNTVLLLILALFTVQNAGMVFAQNPVIHAVLFFSPSCGHCHHVITEVLPPLFEEYGDQLQILGVDVTNPGGQTLYQAAIERFDIPDERRGVPALILDQTVLVGSREIPEQLPVLIEQYLEQGGIDWPDIPGLAEVLQAADAAADIEAESTGDETATVASVAAPDSPSQLDADVISLQPDLIAPTERTPDDLLSRLQRDPAGNALAIVVLAAMLAVTGHGVRRIWMVWRARSNLSLFSGELQGWRGGFVAILCLLGLGVSIYLTYVETTHTTAVCGPIGDCNTVQQSAYAVLFGLIPIGVLGILGYTALLIAWAGTRWARGRFRSLFESVLLGMALFGALFSIYLTFLEPFVIGATCIWCLTSAVSMTLILLVLTGTLPVQAESAGRKAHI